MVFSVLGWFSSGFWCSFYRVWVALERLFGSFGGLLSGFSWCFVVFVVFRGFSGLLTFFWCFFVVCVCVLVLSET